MTDVRGNEPSLTKRAGRAALTPVLKRLDQIRAEIERQQADLAAVSAELATVSARLEQQVSATNRLESYVDAGVSDVHNEAADLRRLSDAVRSLLAGFRVGADDTAGPTLRDRLARIAEDTSADLRRDIGDLRATTRLTQSLVERALAVPTSPSTTTPDADAEATPRPATTSPAPDPRYANPTPSFDLLYRAFENRHRGSIEEITARIRQDYLDVLLALPNAELPIADLGCGRGELVHAVADAGHLVVGVDLNAGQVADDRDLLVEDDLFRWLDAQEAGSLRAVTAAHVVEHLPTDLQIRLVFEAHRVLAPGGALILETPNALSMSTAATNMWVDPTHEHPVHPLFLEFVADEAGFIDSEILPLHPVGLAFQGTGAEPQLVADLNSLIFGHGDIAFVAHR